MSQMDVLLISQRDAWQAVLREAGGYDTYHLPEYHAVAEAAGEGAAHLFVYRESGYTIALPLLLRSLDGVAGISENCTGLLDATSVYGYGGPIGSQDPLPPGFIRGFQSALSAQLRERRVITVFSRLHPLLPHQAALVGLGECPVLWRTVSIDLTLPLEAQRAGYRKNHREGVSKLIRKGLTCVHDSDWRHFDVFQEIYAETMRHVEASPSYYFSAEYFTRLRDTLGAHVHLFAVLHENRPVCAALMFESQGILQYHLSGTSLSARKLAPMKLLLDGVREWGTRRGLRVFHLGGGMTARPDDPLFHFKLGFSDRTHDFAIWRWIIEPDVYRTLCEARAAWNSKHGLCATSADFFPQYRCPAGPPAPTAEKASRGREASEPYPELTGANS